MAGVMHMTARVRRRSKQTSPWDGLWQLGVLSGCFLLGACGGFLFSAGTGSSGELQRWLETRFRLYAAGEGPAPNVPAVLWDVFRWPAAAFALRFTALGAVGVPILMAARGFLLSFTAMVFVQMFGFPGAAAVLVLFSVTVLLVIPVLFVVADNSFARSVDCLKTGTAPAMRSPIIAALFPLGILALAACLQITVIPVWFAALCAFLF